MSIPVGFVGLSKSGWASLGLAPAMFQHKDKYTLKAVSTTSPESASASAEKYTSDLGYPVKAYHGDTSQIAGDPDVGLVVVAVKAPNHKAAVLPAIEAGKDIFIEWPVGANIEQTTEIVDAARKKGIRAIVGLQGRHSPAFTTVKELINAGKIGKIRSTSIITFVPRELNAWGPVVSEKNAYLTDAASGASMLEIGMGHQLDIVTHLLGEFSSVSATTAIAYPTVTLVDASGKPTGNTVTSTVSDHIAFSGELKSGAVASVTWRSGYSLSKGRKQLLWIIDGDDGSITMEDDDIQGSFSCIHDPKVYLNGELVEIDGHGSLTGNLSVAWAEFAKGPSGTYATLEDAVRNRRLLHAIATSGKEGRTVYL